MGRIRKTVEVEETFMKKNVNIKLFLKIIFKKKLFNNLSLIFIYFFSEIKLLQLRIK